MKRDELIKQIEAELPSMPMDGDDWRTCAKFSEVADFILNRERELIGKIRHVILSAPHGKKLATVEEILDQAEEGL